MAPARQKCRDSDDKSAMVAHDKSVMITMADNPHFLRENFADVSISIPQTISNDFPYRDQARDLLRIAGVLAVMTMVLPLHAAGPERATIYVDAQLPTETSTNYDPASRTCGGGDAIAYRTLGAALPAAEAGTTVIFRSGQYADVLIPAHSGEEGSTVEFKCMPGENVYLTGAPGIYLASKSYIVIDGLRIENTTWLESRNSHHNLIENCRFRNTPAVGTTGNARFVQSHYNRIRNNRFEEGNDNLLLIDANFNVVEGNTILQGRHSVLGIRCGDHNIIRGNYFANSWQKIAEVYDCGQDTSAVSHSFDSTKRNVFEDNVFAATVSYYSTSGGNGIQYSGQQGIIRRNVFYHCNVGLGMQVYGDEASYNYGNRIYHNVFYDNKGAGIETGSNTLRNAFKNNILFANEGVLADCFDVSPGQLAYRGSLGNAVIFERNDLFYRQKGDPVVEEDFNIGRTVSQAETLFAGALVDTLEVDPKFVDAVGLDFHLRADSPLRDVGAWLTTTTSAGTGTILTVADATVFYDGFGIPGELGDLIQLEGQGETARILAIDETNNTLTVDHELSWTEGQGVSLPFAGSRPDLGAFETEAVPTGMEAWRQLHFGSDAKNPEIAGDQADPDKDGMSNLLEYALGGDPLTADPVILPSLMNIGGTLGLVFRCDANLTDLTFTVQASDEISDSAKWTDIAAGTDSGVILGLSNDYTVKEIYVGSARLFAVSKNEDAAAVARRFLRLRITRGD